VRWDRDGDRLHVVAEVPPNSRAEVVLPDGQQLAVGSGRHTWTVTAPTAGETRAEVSLDSTLADLVDDPDAFAATMAAIATVDAEVAADVRRHTAWLPGRQLKELFENRVPAAARERVTAALDQLNESRFG
jgi:alpha-L-rhamnosidase